MGASRSNDDEHSNRASPGVFIDLRADWAYGGDPLLFAQAWRAFAFPRSVAT
jgi:hypothetical protein